jgi:PAS domain S-box-containing protein
MAVDPLRLLRGHLWIQFVLPTLLAVTLATGAGAWVMRQRIAHDREQDLLRHSRSLVQTVQFGVETLPGLAELERFLFVAGADPQVRGLWILAGDPPRVLAGSHPEERGRTLAQLAVDWPGLDAQTHRSDGLPVPQGLLFHTDLTLSPHLDATAGGRHVHLLMLVDKAPLEALRAQVRGHFLRARLGVLVVVMGILILVLYVVVLRPLGRLERQVRAVEAGAPPGEIETDSQDEIGRLAVSIRRALADVREERMRFQLVAERNPGLIYRCRNDAQWSMEFMSGAVLEITGRPAADFIGNAAVDYESVIAPEDRDKVREAVERGLAGDRSWDVEYRVVHVDGSLRPVREQGRGHLDGQGQWVLDGIILDQTPRLRERRLAERLQELEKLRQDGLRVMAGSVAHHVNNLLTGLMGEVELAQLELENGHRPQRELEACREISERAAALGRLMLLYVGESHQRRQAIRLAHFVQAHLASRRLRGLPVPHLHLEGSPGREQVLALEGHLEQVLDQLLENAFEAAPAKPGSVVLRTGFRRFAPEDLELARIAIDPAPDGNPFLEVVDGGEGMVPEVLERAFDPFFTTRFTGRGLGLAAVQGIVRLHDAGLVCRSEPGAGTRILVVFPPLNA